MCHIGAILYANFPNSVEPCDGNTELNLTTSKVNKCVETMGEASLVEDDIVRSAAK